jgi:hypothetical protein
MDGEIWVDLSCNLSHAGTMDFAGSLLKSLEKGIKSDSKPTQVPDEISPTSIDNKLKAILNQTQQSNTTQSVEDKLRALLMKDSGGKLNKVQVI